jgi:hypothetical protein
MNTAIIISTAIAALIKILFCRKIFATSTTFRANATFTTKKPNTTTGKNEKK